MGASVNDKIFIVSNKVIIFCQAPADIPFVLSLYEQMRLTRSISIFVINVYGMFQFLSDLKLNVEQLIFIPYRLMNLKQVWKLYSERKRINALYKEYFYCLEQADVYFFSRYEDWLTAAFIHKLSKKRDVNINYLEHYDDSVDFTPTRSTSTGLKGYILILRLLTGINFLVKIIQKLPEFPVDNYSIFKVKGVLDRNIFINYTYHSKLNYEQKPCVLFFITVCDAATFDPIYYIEEVIEIMSILKQYGYSIIVKGHPRLNMPIDIREFADFEIPTYVPGEFINIRDFKMCLGLDTNAICYFAKNKVLPTYSLIKMLSSSNHLMVETICDYLLKQSDNEIQFIDNNEQLNKLAKTLLNGYV